MRDCASSGALELTAVDSGKLEPSPAGDGARLTLTEQGGGTKISSTRYVHYGLIDFIMGESRLEGTPTLSLRAAKAYPSLARAGGDRTF